MSQEQILSSDGIPLEQSLKKAERKNKIRATLLVAPLFVFLLITFVFPIGDMLFRSVDDRMITQTLPNTFKALEKWDGDSLPDEEVYEAFYKDFHPLAVNKEAGKLFQRLNYEKSGFSSGLKSTNRKIIDFEQGNYKEQFMKAHKIWKDPEYWVAIKNTAPNFSYAKYLKGLDLDLDNYGKIVQVEEDRRIHKILWMRTLKVAFWVTVFCFILAYPISHLLATLPIKYSNLLMICVLLPFWTSLLVRTSSWMVLLQQQGPVNDFIVWLGLASDDNRPELMYNVIGTFVAMTQILLPFMVLPLYSVMKTISPSLIRAGKSLGGTPLISFYKIYFPLTIPGIGAGCLLVFILAIGYYITPALVGGASGSLISNTIAYHMKSSLDWAFASALGTMLLVGVLVIYWIYNKLVGIDNIKLG
ncbi:MAG: polyamine ABC transporter substrate-binding protein [Pelagibacteraceae bacterium BACL5 MAG-120705-bin12]|jgi:putative spermidine/putrescine transport system permease protein|uniref:ABC transporter permease n=1 Tax=Candidatus Pelagibacter sp. TaxID=2024849 RepID=UPI000714E8FB|nr:MAG: polyamine ABC transporter substrate-binding protein [Pelagibacteraceae bacterium BACL5 MAG-121015-bin10]KRO60044.1 MAG: polyamine ABC transporter substrate-binding protein [Pelagibacteraceae bacterium BACL5 MAG-120705-bin12]KRO65269.1 MAG: polyamine ABC transporter substrate-binding protein [Pelagibacteraceae bacterium BACL5 MAG-120820-bin39]KRO75692.1 MAG: polyamine ABC transporter substrate-binding protein [Pelagibacteraceae bacterium BACL5 MAG-120813-bin20]